MTENTTIKMASTVANASIAGVSEKIARIKDYVNRELDALDAQYKEEMGEAVVSLEESQSAKIGSGFLEDDARDVCSMLASTEKRVVDKLDDLEGDFSTNMKSLVTQVEADMEALKGDEGNGAGIIPRSAGIRIGKVQLDINTFGESVASHGSSGSGFS